MKGIVVDVREDKRIVMFNTGKIASIPTPPGCRRGMIITVTPIRKRIIIAVCIIAAVVLLALGIALGRFLWSAPPPVDRSGTEQDGHHRRGMGHMMWME